MGQLSRQEMRRGFVPNADFASLLDLNGFGRKAGSAIREKRKSRTALTLAILNRDNLDFRSAKDGSSRAEERLKLRPRVGDLTSDSRSLGKAVSHADEDTETLVRLANDACAEGSAARGARLDRAEVEALDCSTRREISPSTKKGK